MSGKGKKKETAKERRDRLQKNRLYEVYAHTGDIKKAARLMGMGLDMAYRALSDDDGITKLKKHIEKINPGEYLVLTHEQRKSLLTKCFISGLMPRVVFNNETGEPETELLFEPIPLHQRLKIMDMINKMDGSYMETQKLILPTTPQGHSPEVQEKLDSIYGNIKVMDIGEEDDYDPFA